MFRELGEEIERINIANGWEKISVTDWNSRDKIPSLLALIHSEISEALEAFRVDDKRHFAEECADVAIRLISLSSGLEIDLGAEILKKLEKNKARGFRHGGEKRL